MRTRERRELCKERTVGMRKRDSVSVQFKESTVLKSRLQGCLLGDQADQAVHRQRERA